MAAECGFTQEPSKSCEVTVTVTLADTSPHVMVKTCSPSVVITNVSLPDVDLSPAQLPEALQEEALLLVHVMTAELPRNTLFTLADIDDVVGLLGGVVESLLLPPPPQPLKNKVKIKTRQE